MGQDLVCAICGRSLARGEVVAHEEKQYCVDCFHRNFSRCDACGKYFPNTELRTVESEIGEDISYCTSCYSISVFQCEDCGVELTERHPYEWINGRRICGYCFEHDYLYCELCDTYVDIDNWNYDRECCYNCSDNANSELIGEYHSEDINFIGDSKKSWRWKWRGLGFELEIDRGEHDKNKEKALAQAIYELTNNRVNLERDGSLEYGFEIISHPHTLSEFYKFDWSQLLELCKNYGYTSHNNDTCGLHVHVSRYMFGSSEIKQNRAIAKVIYFYENYYSDILKFSRRTEYQANKWAQRYCLKSKREALHCSKTKGAQGRYYAVNLQNRNTIEFRLCRGTLKAEAFYAWIDFTLTLVRNSRNITWKNINDLAEWFKGIKSETIRYMQSRNSFFEGEKQLCA